MINILVAYPYFKEPIYNYLLTLDHSKYSLIVDSGAFTAWNTGKIIKLDEYCKFLDSIEKLKPFHAVQLDVFGNPEESWKNFLTMKSRGYDVMPVFTRGENLVMLENMYKETEYIMFGGVVTGRSNKNYVKWFQERNGSRKVHWLGFVNMDFIKKYKPTSVDSSSWCGAARFGNLFLYEKYGDMKTFKKNDFIKSPSKEIITLASNIGVTFSELKYLGYKAAWSGQRATVPTPTDVKGTAHFMTTLTHVLRMIEVEKHFGTKIYLACGGVQQIQLIHTALKFLKSRGRCAS